MKKHNVRFLYERLKLIDKHVANKISSNDSIRIIRALEINQITRKKPSSLFKCFYKQDIRIKANWVLCWPEYLWLVKRLIKRIDNMFHQGLIEEAVLLRNKLHVNHRLLHTIGYEEALLVNDNKLSLENAKARILLRQTHYAKKQYTWFKKEKWWNRVNPSLINVIDIISKIII